MKSKIKQKQKDLRKYYTKEDIFLSRMASILKLPIPVVRKIFKERATTTIRLNTLKRERREIIQILKRKGVELVEIPWMENAFFVSNMDKSELGKSEEYSNGLFYIQNLSSMIPALALDPKDGLEILDMCAAPGSKTTQIAQLAPSSKITANDSDAWRVGKLVEVLEQFGITNVETRNEEGVYFGKKEKGRYDRVMVDAPCSGEGLIYLEAHKGLKFWNIKKVKPLSNIQKNLIVSAYESLKNNGILVYSTCTLEPEENEGVVTYLLTKYPKAKVVEIDFLSPSKLGRHAVNVKRGILKWNEFEYDKQVSKTYRVIPSSEMMGFYIARIVKNEK